LNNPIISHGGFDLWQEQREGVNAGIAEFCFGLIRVMSTNRNIALSWIVARQVRALRKDAGQTKSRTGITSKEKSMSDGYRIGESNTLVIGAELVLRYKITQLKNQRRNSLLMVI
jgi:hypothetical protein